MTCREKLKIEYPKYVGAEFVGGCLACPMVYGYLARPSYCNQSGCKCDCTACWDREIPGTEKTETDTPWGKIKTDIPWEKISEMVEEGMQKRDREIHLYFNPETGVSVNFYPWPSMEELYEQFEKGRIIKNQLCEKMDFSPATLEELQRDAENFLKGMQSTSERIKNAFNQSVHMKGE